ncbi:MAG: B12-binding domain-containing radical SAM protein [Promethearchaeota archaeon]
MNILFFFKDNENLGIEYLSAVLKAEGHKTDLIFDPGGGNLGLNFFEKINGFGKSVIDNKIKTFKPDLICISTYSNTFQWTKLVGKYIKKKYGIPILLGGPHPTIIPDYVIKQDFVDFIIVGEGEIALKKFVENFEAGKGFDDVPNLWYKIKKEEDSEDHGDRDDIIIKKNKLCPLITDLDGLPFPDKDLFYKFGAFSERYYLMTGRGCPHNCTYCINHQLHNIYPGQPRVRWRSINNIMEELKWAKKKYNFKSIYFYDDNFLLSEKRVEEFCKGYIDAKINLPFKCLTHPLSVNERKIKMLRTAGCSEIDMGIESGSDFIRKNIFHRNIPRDKMIKSAMIIKKYGIKLTTLNIINNPKESIKDMLQTVKINTKIMPAAVHITSLYPYPNTQIAKFCIEEKILDEATLKKTYEGVLNYRNESILNHPYKTVGEHIRLFAPLFIHFPKRFLKYIFQLPTSPIFNVMYLFTSTALNNAFRKIREYIRMLIKSQRFYRKKKYLK